MISFKHHFLDNLHLPLLKVILNVFFSYSEWLLLYVRLQYFKNFNPC